MIGHDWDIIFFNMSAGLWRKIKKNPKKQNARNILAALFVALDQREMAVSCFSMLKKDIELCLSSTKSKSFYLCIKTKR